MTTTNKIFLQLLERDIGSNNRNKWTSWTIVTRVIAYYSTLFNATKSLVILVGLGVAQGKKYSFLSFLKKNILFFSY